MVARRAPVRVPNNRLSSSGIAPSAPPPRLRVYSGGAVDTVVGLTERGVVIGRSHDADLRLDDEGVSRTHCKVYPREGLVYVEDLGSANGTLVNGVAIEHRVLLAPGDRVQVGLALFGLDDEDEEEEEPSPRSA